MPSIAQHEFVYRLLTDEEWEEMRKTGAAPQRKIDRDDGYFHLSTKEQALETARLHFRDVEGLLALEIPLSTIALNVKFELAPKRGEKFPHLYGPLKKDHVRRVVRLERTNSGFEFGDAL